MTHNFHNSPNLQGPVILISRDILFTFPFSLGYLAGSLLEKGFEVIIKFFPRPQEEQKFIQEIVDLKPLTVGFGSLYPDLALIKKYITALNEAGRKFPIVIGGQMVSPTPDFALIKTGADFGVIGEGEISFSQLCTNFRNNTKPYDTSGLIIKQAGSSPLLTGAGEFIRNLSELPKIPYHLFPADNWLRTGRFYTDKHAPHYRFAERSGFIHGGRGCPFKCNFCYHHSLPRYRPIPDIMNDIVELQEKFRVEYISFTDETVLVSKKRTRSFVEAMQKLSKPCFFDLSCRFDILSRLPDELLIELKETGCRCIGLGLESGSERILKAMKKDISTDEIRHGLSRLKKAGILPSISMMVGQLDEEEEDVLKTTALLADAVRENPAIVFNCTIATPFPGTELYAEALKRGLLKDNEEFYQRFFQHGGLINVTINMSHIADEKLVILRNNLLQQAENIRREFCGTRFNRLQNIRTFLHRKVDRKNRDIRKTLKERPVLSALYKFLVWPYQTVYEKLQKILERLSLNSINIS